MTLPGDIPKEVRVVLEEINSDEHWFSDNAFFFILDHHARRVVWLSSNVCDMLGYDLSHYPFLSLYSFLRIISKDDLQQFMLHQKKIKQNFSDWSHSETLPIKIAQDVRVKTTYQGAIRLLLQQQILLSDKIIPLWSVGSGMNINHLKEDEDLSLAVFNGDNKELSLKKVVGCNRGNFFTEREIDVLRLLGKGLKSEDVKYILNISLHTVRTHRRNMLKKTGLDNTSQLINFAIKEGILR